MRRQGPAIQGKMRAPGGSAPAQRASMKTPDSLRDEAGAFAALFAEACADATFGRLVLSKPRGMPDGLVRVSVRAVVLKGEPCLSFLHTHKTRDLTRNLAAGEAVRQLREWLEAGAFGQAHLFTTTAEAQLLVGKKGTATLLRKAHAVPAKTAAAPSARHDREKHRYLELDRPFLAQLGVTDAEHRLVPAMARKWKQINKFVEVLDHALDASGLKAAPRIDVVDFGSGKGYLTFAMHDYLRHTLALAAEVEGVELRQDMVELCNGAAGRLGLAGLRFSQGDVRSVVPESIDVMVALHACDTATDHAIHTGVRAGASVIMCSPCCHKELRPQLLSPHPLRPILKHGVHLGQQAEMLTDGLRAMLLDACGYDTQVFEFVALEHTNKNKMILAVKRASARPAGEVWQQIEEIKGFYGIRDQCLETLLKADMKLPPSALRSPPPEGGASAPSSGRSALAG
jgi:SAM-dependent methyltransferase